MSGYQEKRQYERFKPPEYSAYVVFRPKFDKIGPINDISRGGLGFSYHCFSNHEVPAAETAQRVDIIARNDSFRLRDIPCTVVYDAVVHEDRMTFMPDLVSKLCGLKFGRLTPHQKKQITLYLEKYIVGRD